MNILVVCAGNTCRSPMGAGLLRQMATSRSLDVDVRSAGLRHQPGGRVAENAVTVMKELGVDISNDYSKPVTSELLLWADVVVVVERSHKDYLIEDFPEIPEIGSKVRPLEDNVHDPYGGSVAEYRGARDALHRLLSRLMDLLQAAAL